MTGLLRDMKRLFLLASFFASNQCLASSSFMCTYKFHDSAKATELYFQLPDEVRFGLLVPMNIKTLSGSESKMNIVVLKDYPYLVMADVYRIESEKSKIFLMKITPDRKNLELAFVNMGSEANAKFYNGSCKSREERK